MDLATLGLKVDSSQIKRSNRDLDELDRNAKQASKSAKGMGAAFGAAAAGVAGMLAGVVGMGQVVQTLRGFEASMAQVQAITRASDETMARMRQQAKDLGSTTEFSASQAADALGFLGMAGLNAEQSMAALPQVIDLATVSGMGLAQSADVATNVMGGFKLEVADLPRVMDVMARTSTIANTSVSQLGEAFIAGAGPAARQAGVDIETAAAAVGVLSDAGLQGSRAGTALNAIFTKLQVPTKQARDELNRYNLTAEDVDISTRGLIPVLQTLADAEIDTATAAALVGLEHNKALDVILQNVDSLGRYVDETRAAGGASEEMAAIMRDTLDGDFKSMSSALEGLILELGEQGLVEALRTGVKGVTEFLRALTKFEHLDKLAMTIAGVGAAMAALAFPVATATAALAAGAAWVFTNWDMLGQRFPAVVGAIEGGAARVGSFFSGIAGAVSGLGPVVSELGFMASNVMHGDWTDAWAHGRNVVSEFKTWWDGLAFSDSQLMQDVEAFAADFATGFEDSIGPITESVQAVLDEVQPIIDSVTRIKDALVDLFSAQFETANLDGAMETLGAIAGFGAEALATTVEITVKAISALLDGFGTALEGDPQKALGDVASALGGIAEAHIPASVLEGITSFFRGFSSAVSEHFQPIAESLSATWESVKAVFDSLQGVGHTLKDLLTSAASDDNLLTSLSSALGTIAGYAGKGVANMLEATARSLELFAGVLDAGLKGDWQGVLDEVQSFFDWATDFVVPDWLSDFSFGDMFSGLSEWNMDAEEWLHGIFSPSWEDIKPDWLDDLSAEDFLPDISSEDIIAAFKAMFIMSWEDVRPDWIGTLMAQDLVGGLSLADMVAYIREAFAVTWEEVRPEWTRDFSIDTMLPDLSAESVKQYFVDAFSFSWADVLPDFEWTSIIPALPSVSDLVNGKAGFTEGGVAAAQEDIEALRNTAEQVGLMLTQLEATAASVSAATDGMLQSVIQTLGQGSMTAVHAGLDIAAGLAQGITSGQAAAVGAAQGVGTAVSGAFTSIPPMMHQIGVQIMDGLAQGIIAQSKAAAEAAAEAAAGVAQAARDALDIRSPSRVMAEVGSHTMSGLAQGITESAPLAYAAVDGAAVGVAETSKVSFGAAGQVAGQSYQVQFLGAVDASAPVVAEAVAKTAAKATAASQPQTDAAFNTVGTNAMAAAGKGISKGAPKVSKAVKDAGDKALTTAQQAFGSLADAVGNSFGQLLTGAFDSFDDFLKSIADAFKQTIAQLISHAISNPIKVAFGLVGPGAAGAGAAGAVGGAGGLAAGASGGGLGGIGGAVSGFVGAIGTGARSVIQGFMSGGFGGAFGAIKSAVGGLSSGLSGLGAALGAVAVPLLAITAIFSFFKSKTELLNTGLRATIRGFDVGIETFRKVRTTKYWGLSSSTSTTYKRASDEVAEPIIDAIVGTLRGVGDLVSGLGLEDVALEDFRFRFKVSTMGKSDDEIAAAIERKIEKLSSAAVDHLMDANGLGAVFDTMKDAGESSIDALVRMSEHLVGANAALDMLGQTAFEISIYGADAASSLVKLFGTLEDFTDATGTYFELFFSEAEQMAYIQRKTRETVEELGLVMPETREQFKLMVSSMHLNSEYGREMYATLVQMAAAFDEVLPAMTTFSDQIAMISGVANDTITQMVSEAQAVARESGRAATEWARAAESLRDLVTDLRLGALNADDPSASLEFNQRRLAEVFAAARGGDVDAAREYTSIAQDVLDSARASASNAVDLRLVEVGIRNQANLLAGMSELNEATMTVQEALAEQQIAVLGELSSYLQSEGVTEAGIAEFTTALGQIEAAIQEAEMINYDFLHERLSVAVDLIAEADIPESLRTMLENAEAGIEATITFAVMDEDLSPEVRWLTLQQVSQHIRTIELIGQNDLDAELAGIALAESSNLLRTLNLVADAGLDEQLTRIALAENSNLLRRINVILEGTDDRADAVIELLGVSEIIRTLTLSIGDTSDGAALALLMEEQPELVREVVAVLSQSMDDPAIILALAENGELLRGVAAQFAAGADMDAVLLGLSADSGLVRAISAIIDASTDPEAMLLALADNSLLVRSIGLQFADGVAADLRALALATAGDLSKTLRIVSFAVRTFGVDETVQQLLDLTNGDLSGVIEIGGGLELNLGMLFADALEVGFATPMSALTTSMDDLVEVLRREAEASEAQRVIAGVNALANQNLVMDDEGRLFADDAQLAELAGLAGINTAGMSGEDIGAALAALSPFDGMQEFIYDPTGELRDHFLNIPLINSLQSELDFWVNGDREATTRAAMAEGASVFTIASFKLEKAEALRTQIAELGGVPAFRKGGMHGGGLRVVGEEGIELEATGPARYYSHAQTKNLLSGGGDDTAAEIRALRREVAALHDTNRSLMAKTAIYVKRLTELEERREIIGTPPERATA